MKALNQKMSLAKRINVSMGISNDITISEHNQKELFYNILFNEKIVTEKTYDNIIDCIVSENLHERFTIAIVKKIASNPKHFCCNSCLQIVNSGYNDTILDDLKQEVFIALFEMSQNEHVKLINGNELEFSTYFDKNDNEKSYFLKLYRVVENYMYSQKKHVDNSAICLDSYNNDVTSVNNTSDYISFLYNSLVCDDMSNIVTRNDIKTIFCIIKEKYSKHFSNICIVFESRYKGLTYDDISKQSGLTKNQVRYCMDILRNVFNEYIHNIDIQTDKKQSSNGFASGIITTYVNKAQNASKEDFERYWKNHTPYEKPIVYDSIPLSCGILDSKTKEEIDNVLRDRFDNMFNSETFTHVYNTKNRTLCTINDNGNIVFEYKCATPKTEKALKEKLYNI